MSEAATYLRRVKAAFENHGIRNKVQITEHVAFLLLPQVQDRWEEIRSLGGVSVEPLLMRQKRYNEALQLLDDSDDKASGYGHYYDLMWRIELARALIFARKGRWRDAMLKGQMVLRYRRILGLSNWLLAKQLWQRLRAGTGLPR